MPIKKEDLIIAIISLSPSLRLLFGEAKWEEKTNIKATISKLTKSVANFPKQTDKKIIMAVWCKNNKIKNGEHWLISPRDVLSGLK